MYRIVVADDEDLALKRIRQFLQNIPDILVVAAVRNGQEIVEYLEGNYVDCVITDIRMPLMDGLDVASWISGNRPNCSVVLISAYDEFDYARKAIRLGVKDYLLKPLRFDCLTELLQKLQKEQKTQQRNRLFEKAELRNTWHQSVQQYFCSTDGEYTVPEALCKMRGQICTVVEQDACKLSDEMCTLALSNILTWYSNGCAAVLLEKRGNRRFFVVLFSNNVAEIERVGVDSCVNTLISGRFEMEYSQPMELDVLRNEWFSSYQDDGNTAIRIAEKYILENINTSLSRDVVANAVYMDPSYFSRAFKRQTGVNFHEYVKNLRMEQAKQLLKNGMKVKDVCARIGYQDRNHFNKLFKQYTGCNPQDYKYYGEGNGQKA